MVPNHFYVYAIVNEQTGSIYIGQTNDLAKRLARHNGELKSKATSYTAKRPGKWRYIYTETLGTRSEAMRREKQLKTAKGRAFVKQHLS